MYGIILIIMLILISGLIAYLGDQIGMKVGKKRLSLFGLRPKYSSIIITILTGVLIAIISITILLSIYSGLRQALLNINEVLEKLDNLNEEIIQKDIELQDMKDKIETKANELELLQEQKDGLEEKLNTTEKEVAAARESLRQAESDIKALEENRQKLQTKIAELRQQREELESKIQDINDKLAETTENYKEARELATQYQAGMIYYMGEDIVYQKGDVIYSEVLDGGLSEEKTIKNLNSFLQRANNIAKDRSIKIDEETGMALKLLREDIINAARVIYNMEKGERVIVSLVSSVNVAKNDWLRAKFLLNKNFMVFHKDEIIANKEINADQSAADIEEELRNLLNGINKTAIQRGILPDSKGQVGILEFNQLYQIFKKIQARSGLVEIKVIAREDIWRENRLSSNLEFIIGSE